MNADVYRFLVENSIEYERVDHPPVFTCEEAEWLVPELSGADTKNLFVRDKKARRHFLVAVGHDKSVDLKTLSSALGVTNLSFASSERLKRYLGIEPGAVSLLAIINDIETAEVRMSPTRPRSSKSNRACLLLREARKSLSIGVCEVTLPAKEVQE